LVNRSAVATGLALVGGFETVAERPPQPPGEVAERPPQPPGEVAERPPQPPGEVAERPPRPPGRDRVL